MTLDASGDVQFVSKLIEGVSEDGKAGPGHYLLDGQQRLTSLYQSLRHGDSVATRDRPGSRRTLERWYYIDLQNALDPLADHDDMIFSVPKDKVVRANFGRDVVLDLSEAELEFERHMMPTEKVMDGMAWGFAYAQHWQGRGDHPHGDPFTFFNEFRIAVLDNFSEYQVPVIDLGKDTRKEAVCTVFEKVNTPIGPQIPHLRLLGWLLWAYSRCGVSTGVLIGLCAASLRGLATVSHQLWSLSG